MKKYNDKSNFLRFIVNGNAVRYMELIASSYSLIFTIRITNGLLVNQNSFYYV